MCNSMNNNFYAFSSTFQAVAYTQQVVMPRPSPIRHPLTLLLYFLPNAKVCIQALDDFTY